MIRVILSPPQADEESGLRSPDAFRLQRTSGGFSITAHQSVFHRAIATKLFIITIFRAIVIFGFRHNESLTYVFSTV